MVARSESVSICLMISAPKITLPLIGGPPSVNENILSYPIEKPWPFSLNDFRRIIFVQKVFQNRAMSIDWGLIYLGVTARSLRFLIIFPASVCMLMIFNSNILTKSVY